MIEIAVNKTIYIRDEDIPIWDRAKELAGDKLAPVIVEGLKKFITAKEAEAMEAQGFERIELSFNDFACNNIPRRKAFIGRWLLSPKEPFYDTEMGEYYFPNWAVAITPKGRAVVFKWWEDHSDCVATQHTFTVYESLEIAAAHADVNRAVRKAIEKLGVPLEELDI